VVGASPLPCLSAFLLLFSSPLRGYRASAWAAPPAGRFFFQSNDKVPALPTDPRCARGVGISEMVYLAHPRCLFCFYSLPFPNPISPPPLCLRGICSFSCRVGHPSCCRGKFPFPLFTGIESVPSHECGVCVFCRRRFLPEHSNFLLSRAAWAVNAQAPSLSL